MLYQIGIKDGFAQVKGAGRHIKIISAATPVRLQAMDSDGRVLLDSKFRAPMATELPAPAATLNIYAEDQTVELWYSLQPLDFLQLIAVGANEIKTGRKIFAGGKIKLLDKNPRKSVRITSDKDILIGPNAVSSNGWPIKANDPQDFETVGEIHCYINTTPYDWLSLNQNSVEKRAEKLGLGTLIPFCFEVYKESTYLINSSGQLYKIDADNSHTLLFPDGVKYVFKFASKIFCLRALSNGAYFYESLDGITWNVKSRVIDGAIAANLTGASFPQYNKICFEWLTVPTQQANAMQCAVNVLTGEVKTMPTKSPQVNYAYDSENDQFYFWNTTGLYTYKDGLEQQKLSGNISSADITESGKLYYKLSNGEVYYFNGDQSIKKANSLGPTGFRFYYVKNSGGNLFTTETNSTSQQFMFAGQEGIGEFFNVTHPLTGYIANYNFEGEEIVFAKSSTGLLTRKINAPALPNFESSEVRYIEFLV